MAGTWENQNKALPGAYINIRTNEPLSVTPGERGTAVILQEMSAGEDRKVYVMTAQTCGLPEDAAAADKKLPAEALKRAKRALVCKLPADHTKEDVTAALNVLKTQAFDVLCYPYDREGDTEAKTAVADFIREMRETEGLKCQAVLANFAGDYEGILNVTQGIVLADGGQLTAAEATAWVAGASAGAGMTVSNTGAVYQGAVDVVPRMTKTELEEGVAAGKFLFKVDSAQNVSAVYDINSLTALTVQKGRVFTKNRVIRTLDGIANDIAAVFESSYIGKVSNDRDGRSLLKAALVDYMTNLQNMGAIQLFSADDVSVEAGTDSDAVVVNAAVQPVDSVEKLYITVNLS